MNELAYTQGLRELALFAGAGGGILGGHLLGWRTVCAVEWADYPRKVLLARQRDGILPRFPIWDDVQTFDGNPWRGRVDVVSGGFPCQDISAAGKGAGIDGARSGMWFHMARIVREVRPRFVFVENYPMLTSRGLGRVLGDLAAMGYDAEWGVLGVSYFGGWHVRERIWIAAYAAGERRDFGGIGESNKKREVLESTRLVQGEYGYRPWTTCPTEKSRVLGMANGVAGELDRIKAIGNGQSPIVAATAFRILTERAGWTL
ncbi:MAG: DNA cytosine methyltransferase [Phycisphaerales bacterium]